jgi:hypothetical protein
MGEVRLKAAGASFRIDAKGSFSFERGDVNGKRQATFFIGSGSRARSILWRSDRFVFQLPIAWYVGHGWDLSPGYEKRQSLSLARPVQPECLNCHATGVRQVAGTVNGYDWPPVTEAGIGCERCHGPGAAHASSGGRARIVNPSKLPAAARDSVCGQCHFTGVERTSLPGRSMLSFVVGENVSDYVVAFQRRNSGGPEGLHTTSHFERLEHSTCKKRSGRVLWCGTCHEPHSRPSPAARLSYYRARCIKCHAGSEHAAAQSECIGCHMPLRPASDAGYARFTDHAIPRFADAVAAGGQDDLVAVSGMAGDRETGLAWARMGNASQDEEALRRARDLLDRAYAMGARDGELLAVLAFLTDRAGDSSRAVHLYEQVWRTDPTQTEAVMNLGSSYAAAGRLDEAVEIWQDVARRNPGLESVWIKLASAYLVRRERTRAAEAANTCLTYHPDSAGARDLIRAIEADGGK